MMSVLKSLGQIWWLKEVSKGKSLNKLHKFHSWIIIIVAQYKGGSSSTKYFSNFLIDANVVVPVY